MVLRFLAASLGASAHALPSCDSLRRASLGPDAEVSSAADVLTSDGSVKYCLVKVLAQPAVNIWVGLPSDGSYNGRFMALGCGGWCGEVAAPERGVKDGFAAAETDTGHKGGRGTFGMQSPGVPNTQLQQDYAYRSMHIMAVVSKKLIALLYGELPKFSYWNGCSTGGRQGNMLAQKYPDDFQGILAGAPAVHFDKLALGQLWPQVPMHMEMGTPIAQSKHKAAVRAAIAACDKLDGVADGRLRDPRACHYDAESLLCPPGVDNPECLTPPEAVVINRIWAGATNTDGDEMWYGVPRGAALDTLAGQEALFIPIDIARYWVYLDPSWDWKSLNYTNWQFFFDETVKATQPVAGTDFADHSAFRDLGHKLLMWHGWADPIIMPQGTIDLYDSIIDFTSAGQGADAQEFARLFMAPGEGHCEMDDNVYLTSLMAWVENGTAPDSILAADLLLCPHPQVAIYDGMGPTGAASSYKCGPNPTGPDSEKLDRKANERVLGRPFLTLPLLSVV